MWGGLRFPLFLCAILEAFYLKPVKKSDLGRTVGHNV